MSATTTIRIALAYLALSTGVVGVWATSAPRSFYDDFPGLGQVWIAVDGPYNEHLVRDVGSLNLALTIITVIAIYRPRRLVAQIVAVATLVNGVPHFAYHAFNRPDEMSGSDRASSLVALAMFLIVPVLILLVTRQQEFADDPPER